MFADRVQGTFRAHHIAIYPGPMKTAEISAASQATCQKHPPWSKRPAHETGLHADSPLTCCAGREWPALRGSFVFAGLRVARVLCKLRQHVDDELGVFPCLGIIVVIAR